jgi:hypothetical protein
MYVSKNRDAKPSLVCRIPKPVAEALGNPTSIQFCIEDGKVCVEGVFDHE